MKIINQKGNIASPQKKKRQIIDQEGKTFINQEGKQIINREREIGNKRRLLNQKGG